MKPADLIESHFRLMPLQKAALKRLRLATLADLLYYFPNHYGEPAHAKKISELMPGDHASICGKVVKVKISKGYRTKIPMAEMVLEDTTGHVKAVWFHQAYMAKKVPEGAFARITGTVTERKGEIYFANPNIEQVEGLELTHESSLFGTDTLAVAPVYPESRGISSLWLRHHIDKLLKARVHEQIEDPISKEILGRYHLPSLAVALVWIHTPRKEADARAARKRFAFEEIFLIQLARQKAKRAYQTNLSFIIKPNEHSLQTFLDNFAFEPTGAQRNAIAQIIGDFGRTKPMMRLLEGDVGSGKTAVAATVVYATITTAPTHNQYARLQVAYMAPTEILAKQHFQSFIQYLANTGIQLALLTGSGCMKFPSKNNPTTSTPISRPQLLKWIAAGDISIVIGTHTLIQKTVRFRDLGLVIIDEQHRFGVNQRLQLAQKKPTSYNLQATSSCFPHLLSMTATPIPRTLALTIYGDLDLTVLDEMPHGRKPIVTKIVLPALREQTYEAIRTELKAGRQLYIICPRIFEPDPAKELALNAKSAVAEAKRLQEKIFPEFKIGIVHSKLLTKAKDKIMSDFASGIIRILVATSVVEVGVNVPNATMIIIEGAERFGLAQLHQLRGRVLRSAHQAYCYIFSDSKSEKTISRLNALIEARSGFELAERDLELRGSGELSGNKQWGISDIGMEAIKNLKMVSAAREEARKLLDLDPNLERTPALRARVTHIESSTHFE